LPTRDFKTYKVKKDHYAGIKKDAVDTMRKPVAVPMNQYMGLTLLASKDKAKLVHKLTKEASKAIDSYADMDVLEVAA
jgi:hypothetical protein